MKAKLTVTVDGRELWRTEIVLPTAGSIDITEWMLLPDWAKAEEVRSALKPAPELEKTSSVTEVSSNPA